MDCRAFWPQLLLSLATLLCIGEGHKLRAQPERSKTGTYVRLNVVAARPDATGRQQVVVTLNIDKDYYLLGHDLSEDLKQSRLKVDFLVEGKPVAAMLTYPAGKRIDDETFGAYAIYLDQAVISGVVQRTAGDMRPLEIVVRMQGYPRLNAY
ncbi:MAG: hypothetical protein FJ271_32625 [Planctomycetes bacterium]|nr:hypothetical protein [Planctomycetota bacterium]